MITLGSGDPDKSLRLGWEYSSELPSMQKAITDSQHLKKKFELAPVVHTCNPNYSRVRDQEKQGSRPALANSQQEPLSNILNTKQGFVAQVGERLCSKPEVS
jgi:hypothetical protein